MPRLPSDLRKTLENDIMAARRAAEEAARTSLTTLAVTRSEPYATMDEAQRQLRRGLRAKARQLGDDTKSEALSLLTHEVAYEQWHRMLFARFLAENHPFVTAGVLRSKFTINWHKDRGANPDGSERINDRHVTRAEKEMARAG